MFDYETLDPYQAGKVIKDAELIDSKAWYGRVDAFEYKGRIVRLASTDLFDDVRVGRGPGYLEQCKQVVANSGRRSPHLCYGARVTDDAFYVITHMTDG